MDNSILSALETNGFTMLEMDKSDALLLVNKMLRLDVPAGCAIHVESLTDSNKRLVYVSQEYVKFIVKFFLEIKTLAEYQQEELGE